MIKQTCLHSIFICVLKAYEDTSNFLSMCVCGYVCTLVSGVGKNTAVLLISS